MSQSLHEGPRDLSWQIVYLKMLYRQLSSVPKRCLLYDFLLTPLILSRQSEISECFQKYGAVYSFISKVNPILQMNHLDEDQKQYILEGLETLNEVLGVFRLQGCPLAPDVNALIQKREQARMLKDWGAADTARGPEETLLICPRSGNPVIKSPEGSY